MAEIQKEKPMPLSNIFVLENVPPGYDEQNIKDYVESTLDMEIYKVITNPLNHKKALVIFKEKLSDFSHAAALIKAEKLESLELVLLQTYQLPAVVVTENDFDKLKKEALLKYLNFTSGDCEKIILGCDISPVHKLAVVHFASDCQEVVAQILTEKDHIPLPSEDYPMQIYPCYYNFNDEIPSDVNSVEPSNKASLNINKSKEHPDLQISPFESAENLTQWKKISFSETNRFQNAGILKESHQCMCQIDESEKIFSQRVKELESLAKKLAEENAHLKIIMAKENACLKKERTEEISHLKKEMAEENANLKKERMKEISHLKKEMAEENACLKKGRMEEISHLKQEMTEENAYLKKEMAEEIASLKKVMAEDNAYIKKVMEKEHVHLKQEMTEEIARLKKLIGDDIAYIKKVMADEHVRLKKEMTEEITCLKKIIVKIPVTELQAKCLEQYIKTNCECKIYYDSEAKIVVLKGPQHVMQKCHCDFLLELRKVREISIPLSTDVESILSLEKGKMFLQKLNSLELKTTFVALDRHSLVVASIDESMLNEAVKLIKEKVECSENFKGNGDIPLDKINTLKFKIEYNYMAKVNWDEKKSQFIVSGIKDDVLTARKEVEKFLEDYDLSKKFDVGEFLEISSHLPKKRIYLDSSTDYTSSDSETGVKQHSTSRMKVASFIGRGGSHMKPKSTEKVEESKVKDVQRNTSREKDVECNIESQDNNQQNKISSSKTTAYRGRGRGLGRGLALAVNDIIKESDAEDKSKKHSDSQHLPFISRGNFTQRGRGINHAQMKVKTTLGDTNSFQNDGHLKESHPSKYETDKNAKLLSQKVEELERRKKEIEEENPRLKEEIVQIKVTPLQAKCLEPYMKTLNECKVYYDTEARVAVLKGHYYVMIKYHCDFLFELRKVKETYIPLSTDVESILSSEKGKMFLQKLNSSELKTAFVELNTNSLVVASLEESMLDEGAKLVKEKVEYSETFNGKADIPLDKINTLKLKIEYSYMAKVIWDENKSQLVITGIKDDVLAARKNVENFLEDYGVSERSFDVGDPLANYFFSCLEHQVKHISKSVNFNNYTFTKHQISLRFQGSKVETIQVLRKLEDLKIQTKILKWDLLEDFKAHEVFLIVNCFKSGKLNDIEKKFLYKKVLLDFSKLSSFNLMSSESKSKRNITISKSNSTNQVKVSTAHISSSVKSASPNEITFSVTNSCQLIIKSNGDIVQENSDILVSVLGTDFDLRKTRVGGTFHHACKSHWKEVISSSKANPNHLLVIVKNPVDLQCLAVCHVILEPWNPKTSSSNLISAIQQVLNEAKALGAKTISFPPLGCGAAFKYPPSDVAQVMFQIFQSMNVGSFLQKIVLLAPDSNLLNEFKSHASTLYKSTQTRSISAAGSIPQASSPKTNPEKDISDDSTDDSDDADDYLKLENISTNKSDNSTEVVILTQHENNFGNLKKQLKQDLQELCVHTDYFNQDIINFWPVKSRKKIVELAKKRTVWIERSPHPTTGCAGFFLKGEKSAVTEVTAFIQQEFLEISSRLPQKRMSSVTALKKGTVDFMQYAIESDYPIPSYWSLNESKSFWEKSAKCALSWFKSKELLANVDQEIKSAITKLVRETFDRNLVGKDRQDGAGLTHTNIKVVDVQRVENVVLFEKYNNLRKKLFQKMLKMKQICSDIKKIPGSKGNIETTKCLSDAMKKELYFEVNEHYLFYGTDNFEHLIKHGIDPRSAEIDGLFGKGIYATEMSTKADQYSDSKSNRKPNGTPLTLILARVLLGNVFLCNDQYIKRQAGKKLSRPPCIKCLEDRCKCPEQTLFDSVMGDGSRLFRQFVIYEKDQFYPEYVITYVRE